MKQKIPKSKIQRLLRASVAFAMLVCFVSLFQTNKADAQMYGFTPDPQLGCTVSGSYVNSDPLNYRARMYNYVNPSNGEQTGRIKIELRRGTGLPTSFDGSGVIRAMRVRSGLEFIQDIPYAPGCNTYYADQLYITNTSMLPPPGETDSLVLLVYRTHDCNGNPTGVQVGAGGYSFMGYYVVTNNMFIQPTAPTSGSVWDTGNAYWITWESHSIDRVHIDLYKAGQYVRRIATNIVNTSGYSWDVPSDLYTGDDYQIRIINAGYGTLSETSAMFRINGLAVPTPVVSLVHQGTTVTPSALVYNQSGTITATVRNTGNASFTKNVYISLYNIAANTTTVLKTYSGGIPAGQTVNITDTRIYMYPVGTYTILVACDKEEGNGLRELYRQNVSIQQPVQNSYDVKVNSLNVAPEAFEKGQPGGFASSVTNIGTQPVQVYMSLHKADGTYITDLVAGTLLAGKTQMLSKLNYKITSEPGTYRVVMKYYNPDTRQYVHVQEKEVRVLDMRLEVGGVRETFISGQKNTVRVSIAAENGIIIENLKVNAKVKNDAGIYTTLTLMYDKSSSSKSVVFYNWNRAIFVGSIVPNKVGKLEITSVEVTNRFNSIQKLSFDGTADIKTIDEILKESAQKYVIPPAVIQSIYDVERSSTFKLSNAVGPMNAMIDVIVDGGLQTVAHALINGSSSFTGWPEYYGLTVEQVVEKIKTDPVTGIRAAVWTLRYTAHTLYKNKEMHYSRIVNNNIDPNYPQDCVESWFQIIARYGLPYALDYANTVECTKACMHSNYVYRVFNQMMNKGIKVTLPPHFIYRLATQEEIDRKQALASDASLIPQTFTRTDIGMDGVWMRVTVPFLPGRDLGELHRSDKSVYVTSGEKFEIQFPFAGSSAYTHTITAVYDYTMPDIHTGDGYAKDEVIFTGSGEIASSQWGKNGSSLGSYRNKTYTPFQIVRTMKQDGTYISNYKFGVWLYYDGHPGYDYVGYFGKNPKNMASWFVQYPTAPGKVFYTNSSATTYGQFMINHENGYRSVYVHASCINPDFAGNGSNISVDDMNTFFVKTGHVNADVAHGHYQLQRCLSNDPNEWKRNTAGMWISVDPYGYDPGRNVPSTERVKNLAARKWTTARHSVLWSSQSRKSTILLDRLNDKGEVQKTYDLPMYGRCDGQTFYTPYEEESERLSMVENSSSIEQFLVYPNPAQDNLCVVVGENQEGTLSIVSMDGRTVKVDSILERTSVYVGDISDGLYFVYVTIGKKRLVKKVVVSR